MGTKSSLILGAVGLAVATMLTALVGGAPATAAAARPQPPTVHITYNAGSVPRTGNAFDFRPGLVRLRVSDPASPWGSCPLWVVRLDHGYTFTQWRHDQLAAVAGDLAAGARLTAKTEDVGGASTVRGHTVTSTVTLPSAGHYIMTVFRGGKNFTKPIEFNLAGDFERRAPVSADATIVAGADGHFAGDTHLPTSGTLRFTNNDDQANFLELYRVVPGTTTQDVLNSLTSGDPQPAWMLDGHIGMVVLAPGHSETREYLPQPAGDYVAFSLVPDAAGTPAALAGMIEFVHVGA
jgi:hypothetical protein